MTDQIPADDLRDIIARYRDGASHRGGMILDALKALLPPPPLPTLADMTWEERAACQWMQADVEDYEITAGIIAKINPTGAHLIASDGETWVLELDTVTPRPDLPRLEWPGNENPVPTPALPEGWRLADHRKHGRVIVTNTTPDCYGTVYFVRHSCSTMGHAWHFCAPDELTYIDQEDGTSGAVPPNTLAVGSEWHDVDALARACRESGRDQIIALDRDGDAYVWDEMAEWREGSAPPRFAPYTILHEGKKAHQ